MGKDMKIVYEDNSTLKGPFTVATGGESLYVKLKCAGKPFYAWASIPAGQVIACDFTNAPIGTTNLATNAQLIADITATPEQVLTYAP